MKGFVDGYLRRGAAHEIKSISGAVPSDGGYAVPRQIDAAIAGGVAASFFVLVGFLMLWLRQPLLQLALPKS